MTLLVRLKYFNNLIELLIKTERSEERLNQLKVVKNSGKTLLSIINDILDLSKIESGKMSLESHPCNPVTIFTESGMLFEELIAEKQIVFSVNLSDDLPHCILTDDIRLKQVVFNLLSNAVKFTPRGGRVSLDARYDSSSKMLHCSVSDTGPGIAGKNLKKIFNTFEQEDNSTTRKFGGTGLGLSISLKLVEMMGGRLNVESTPGSGSRFFFEMDVATCDDKIPDASESTGGEVSSEMIFT